MEIEMIETRAVIRISETIELPTAERLGKETGGRSFHAFRWLFACSVCQRWTMRRNRWTLAGAHVCPGCATDHNADTGAMADAYTARKREEREERCEAISAMYGHAEVSYPDSHDSPGALWLLQLHNAITEAWDDGRITPDATYPEDVMSEISDALTPIYTHNRWQIFVDLCAYDFDVDAELIDTSNMTEVAGTILREVAYRAFSSWRDEKIRESTCEDCDEFPCECPEYGECQECGVDAFECYESWAEVNGLASGQHYRMVGSCATEF